MPVFKFKAVMIALGTFAPVGSSTLPETTASVLCAQAADANKITANNCFKTYLHVTEKIRIGMTNGGVAGQTWPGKLRAAKRLSLGDITSGKAVRRSYCPRFL